MFAVIARDGAGRRDRETWLRRVFALGLTMAPARLILAASFDPTWLFLLLPVAGALVAGGLALYRLGHARGRRSTASTGRSAASTEQGGRPLVRRDSSTVTTQDIVEAVGISRRTVSVWVNLGFLPPPRRVPIDSGFADFFPHWAITRARFVMEKRSAGFTHEQVLAMLDHDDDPPPRGGSAVGVA